MKKKYDYITDVKLREEKILKIFENDAPIAHGEKLKGLDNKYMVFKVPLECLVYNHLNDRFASRRREYKSETNKDLKLNDIESQNVISDFIWKSNLSRNKETLEDILKNKQQEYGVITQDGRIIDGNRRVRIIREIFYSDEGTYANINKDDFKFFKAIILEGNFDDIDIQGLETKLQMGKDEKVDYNAIEKYLKVNKLKEEIGWSYKEIGTTIKSVKTEKKAREMHNIYKLICEYLVYIKAKDKFSLVEKMEDHFITLSRVLHYYSTGNYIVGWNPDDNDIIELKAIAFNYIRAGYEGKHFRNLMGGQRDQKGVFANAEVWDKFKRKHNALIDDIETKIESKNQKNEFDTTKERESYFIQQTKRTLQIHLNSGIEALKNKKKSNEARELADEALSKLDSIDLDYFILNFDKSTYKVFEELHEKVKQIRERVIRDVFKKRRE